MKAKIIILCSFFFCTNNLNGQNDFYHKYNKLLDSYETKIDSYENQIPVYKKRINHLIYRNNIQEKKLESALNIIH